MSDTKALQDVVAKALANWGNGEAQDAFEVLMGRLRDAAADNAALLAKIRTHKHAEACDVEDEWDASDTDGCECVLKLAAGEHPGAALLEEVEGVKSGRAHAVDMLRNAHNAALEEAANVADEEWRHDDEAMRAAEVARRDSAASAFKARCVASSSIAEAIRDLKKTGQGA